MCIRDSVKALNERREQLKAGITASTAKRRAKLVRKNQTADKMRTVLGRLQVLQETQITDCLLYTSRCV